MQEHTGFRTPCKKVSSVARKAVQKGQEAPYHRRSRTVLSGVQGVYRRHRAGDTPAKEQAEEEELLLFGQEKKKHAVKKQVMANKLGLILHQTCHAKGRKHDYAVYKDKHPVTPPQVERTSLTWGTRAPTRTFPP